MTSTAHTLAGLFFLRGRPQRVRLPADGASEASGLYLPLIERVGAGVLHRGAIWRGPEAAAFVQQHTDQLKPGCALDVALHHIHVAREEVTGYVLRCQLAPARWPGAGASASRPSP